MSDVDFSQVGGQYSFDYGTVQVSETTAKILAGTATVDEISALSPEEREKVLQEISALLVSSSPMLQLYSVLSSPLSLTDAEESAVNAFSIEMSLEYQNVVSEMLDAWNKNIQDINEQQQEELRSTAEIARQYRISALGRAHVENNENINTENQVRNATEFNVFVRSLPPEMREEVIYSQAQIALDNYLHSLGGGIGGMEVSDALREGLTKVMVGAVVAGFALDFAVASLYDPSTTQVAVNPAIDSLQSNSHMLNSLSSQLQEATLLTINLFVTQAAFASVALSFKITNEGGGEQIHDRTTAEQYADRIVQMIGSDGFTTNLNNILADKIPNYNEMSQDDKTQLFYMVKVGMLVSALAVLYQVDTSANMIDADLAAMLSGEADIPEGSKEAEVLQALRGVLYSTEVPPDARVSLIESILAYLDSKPDLSSLFQPQEAIGGLLDQFLAGYQVEQQG
ncbi:MAG: hypothetical protein KDK72_09595 [Chlamydiia bacterium]|nr:hypothetical protein [Chlamydiia bacterium]